MSTVIFGISVKQFEHGSVSRKQIVLAAKFCLLRRKFLGKAFQSKISLLETDKAARIGNTGDG